MDFTGDFTKTKIHSDEEWKRDHKTFKLFDLVYGRILYSVHQGYLIGTRADGTSYGAIACTLVDCREMFKTVLPNMQKTIRAINKATVELPEIMGEIKRIQEEIAALDKTKASLEEADKCIFPHGDVRGPSTFFYCAGAFHYGLPDLYPGGFIQCRAFWDCGYQAQRI